MAKDLRIVRRAFNAGEVSPQFAYRNDTEKHAFACSKLENFYVSPIGGISRREGTRFLAAFGSAKGGNSVRLVPFEYNRELSYVLAFWTGRNNAGGGEWTYKGEAFDLTSPFSACFKMPENFQKVISLAGLKISSAAMYYDVALVGGLPFTKDIGVKITTENAHGLMSGSRVKFYDFTAQMQLSFKGEIKTAMLIKAKEYEVARVFDSNSFLVRLFDDSVSTPTNFSYTQGGGYVVGDSITSENASFVQFETTPILSKGNFVLDFDSATRKFSVSDLNVSVESSAVSKDPHDIYLVYNGGRTRLFDGEAEILDTQALTFADDGGGLNFYSSADFGDSWGLKVFNFDIADSLAYYKMSDFAKSADETDLIVRNLDYAEQTSLYCSSIVAGILHYDWEKAKAKESAKIEAAARAYIDEGGFGFEDYKHPVIAMRQRIVSLREEQERNEVPDPDLDREIAACQMQLVSLEGDFKAFIAKAYGCANWADFYAASKYTSEDALLEACLNGTFVFPVDSVGEVITVPFSIPKGADVDYVAQSDNVSATLDGDAIVSGIATKTYSAFKLSFTMTAESVHSWTCERFVSKFYSMLKNLGAEWTDEKAVKLSAFDIEGGKFCDGLMTPIPAEVLDEFQYKQVGGDIYFVHNSFAPKKLSFDGEKFAWSEAVSLQPSKTLAEDGLVLTSDVEGQTDCYLAGDLATVKADNAFFTGDKIGTQLKIDYIDDVSHTYTWKYPSEGLHTKVFPACGEITVAPQGGVWDGVLVLEESTDGGKTWAEIGRTTSIQGSDNTSFKREVYDVNSLVRCTMLKQNKVQDTSSTKVEAATEGCFFNISRTARCSCWVEIVGVNSPTNATVKYLNPARKSWVSTAVYKSCWDRLCGYPRTVDIHEERLALGGNKSQPATVWLSQTNNWDNFRSVSNLDTDPLAYTLASDDGEPISWIVSRSDMMIGMGSSEWSLGSRDASQSLTSSIVQAANQSEDGVEYIMPTKAGNMVIYVRRGGRELGSITYDFASDAYNTVSLTTINPDILGGGVKCIFNQLSPCNRIWAIRDDGQAALFSYDRENNVAAWSRFIFGDGVAGGCAISTGKFKSVFLAVKRGDYLCLERLDPNEMGTDNWLDCVPISANAEAPEGLPTGVRYTSRMETTPIFLEGHIKVNCAEFIMLDSYGGQYRLKGYNDAGEPLDDEGDWRNLAMRIGDILGNPAPKSYRFTGNCQSGYLEECSIEVKTDERAPFTLCAIAVKAGGV